MGISGLLPILKDITKRQHIRDFSGKKVAIDGYSWLYKGAYSCAKELCENEPTERYVSYCMSRLHLLLHHNVTPIVVFDGDKLPAKEGTENTRFKSREDNRSKARQFVASGNDRAAYEHYQRGIEATPAMAAAFIQALKFKGVEFMVAPYEADAQMAFLARSGDVDAVITEDSDLLTYGCPLVIFKLDKAGECSTIAMADLPNNRSPNFAGFTQPMFTEMCVLAGCDFVGSLPGMGIKKAHAHIKRLRSFMKVIKSLKFSGTKIPDNYEIDVQRALWTFRHQRVFCPKRRELVHLQPLGDGGLENSSLYVPAALPPPGTDPTFLGPIKPNPICNAIFQCEVDPFSHIPFVVLSIRNLVHVVLEGDPLTLQHALHDPHHAAAQRARTSPAVTNRRRSTSALASARATTHTLSQRQLNTGQKTIFQHFQSMTNSQTATPPTPSQPHVKPIVLPSLPPRAHQTPLLSTSAPQPIPRTSSHHSIEPPPKATERNELAAEWMTSHADVHTARRAAVANHRGHLAGPWHTIPPSRLQNTTQHTMQPSQCLNASSSSTAVAPTPPKRPLGLYARRKPPKTAVNNTNVPATSFQVLDIVDNQSAVARDSVNGSPVRDVLGGLVPRSHVGCTPELRHLETAKAATAEPVAKPGRRSMNERLKRLLSSGTKTGCPREEQEPENSPPEQQRDSVRDEAPSHSAATPPTLGLLDDYASPRDGDVAQKRKRVCMYDVDEFLGREVQQDECTMSQSLSLTESIVPSNGVSSLGIGSVSMCLQSSDVRTVDMSQSTSMGLSLSGAPPRNELSHRSLSSLTLSQGVSLSGPSVLLDDPMLEECRAGSVGEGLDVLDGIMDAAMEIGDGVRSSRGVGTGDADRGHMSDRGVGGQCPYADVSHASLNWERAGQLLEHVNKQMDERSRELADTRGRGSAGDLAAGRFASEPLKRWHEEVNGVDEWRLESSCAVGLPSDELDELVNCGATVSSLDVQHSPKARAPQSSLQDCLSKGQLGSQSRIRSQPASLRRPSKSFADFKLGETGLHATLDARAKFKCPRRSQR